ncbi:MAG: TonB family protein [Acidobacteriota bacterium]
MTMIKKCPQCSALNPPDSNFCRSCGSYLEATQVIPETKALEEAQKEKAITDEFFLGKRYQILSLLGVGGMGKVYKAKDLELDEIVALKVLHPEFSTDEKIISYFKREIKLARKIKHKNVTRIFDLQEYEEKRFISMEYIEGENLKNIIKGKGPLKLEEGIEIIKQVCEALKASHDMGVIHRDISSKNIMIDKDKNVYIMDFGIARSAAITGDPSLTTSGVIGTPHYMAPEQLRGEVADRRTDIYSLGIVMYEIFTGTLPFPGTTPITVALMHLNEKPPSPEKINRKIPPEISNVILKCLEKDREKRFQSVDEILSEIEKREEFMPTQYISIPVKKPPLFIKKIKPIYYAIGGVALFFLIGTFLLIKGPPSKKEVTQLPQVLPEKKLEMAQKIPAEEEMLKQMEKRPGEEKEIVKKEEKDLIIEKKEAITPVSEKKEEPKKKVESMVKKEEMTPVKEPPKKIPTQPKKEERKAEVIKFDQKKEEKIPPEKKEEPAVEPKVEEGMEEKKKLEEKGIQVGEEVGYNLLDKKPQIIKDALPKYPEFMKRSGMKGEVRIIVLISENGDVINWKILYVNPKNLGLEESVVEAVKKFKFSPPEKDNVRVKTWMLLPPFIFK